MMITLSPDLEAVLTDLARRQGVAPEVLALEALRRCFLPPAPQLEPQDEWERRLLAIPRDWGVSLPDSALTSEGLYE